MKYSLSGLLVAMAFSAPAYAQNASALGHSSYAGIVLNSKTSASDVCNRLRDGLKGVTYPISSVATLSSSTSCDEELDKLVKVYGGTRISGQWFVEAGLVSFGQAEASESRTGDHDSDGSNDPQNTQATPNVVVDTRSYNASARAATLSLAYRHLLPYFNQRVTLVTRLGLAYMETRVKKKSQTFTSPSNATLIQFTSEQQVDKRLRPLLGLGAEFRLTDHISAVASADFSTTRIAGKSTRLSAYGLGLGVSFDK